MRVSWVRDISLQGGSEKELTRCQHEPCDTWARWAIFKKLPSTSTSRRTSQSHSQSQSLVMDILACKSTPLQLHDTQLTSGLTVLVVVTVPSRSSTALQLRPAIRSQAQQKTAPTNTPTTPSSTSLSICKRTHRLVRSSTITWEDTAKVDRSG